MPDISAEPDGCANISSKNKVMGYFDYVAATGIYSSRDSLYSGFFKERDKHIADKICSIGRSRLSVLDAGCGDGSGFIRLREKLKRLEITYRGFDISSEMLEKSRNKGLDVVEGDLVDLREYPSGSFDVVLSLFGSIGYLSSELERKTAFREIRRVLSDDGLLALDVFYRPKEQDCTYSLEENSPVEGWIHLFSKGQVGEMLELGGFSVIHCSQHKTVFPMRNKGPKDNLHELYICKMRSKKE